MLGYSTNERVKDKGGVNFCDRKMTFPEEIDLLYELIGFDTIDEFFLPHMDCCWSRMTTSRRAV